MRAGVGNVARDHAAFDHFSRPDCQSSIGRLDWVKDTVEMAAKASGSFRLNLSQFREGQGLVSARLARCRARRRRSVDRTVSSHSTVVAATTLHAPKPTFPKATRIGRVG